MIIQTNVKEKINNQMVNTIYTLNKKLKIRVDTNLYRLKYSSQFFF